MFRILPLVASLLPLSSAAVRPGACPVGGLANTCVRGSAFNKTAGVASYDACCALCSATAACAAFELIPPSTCALKPAGTLSPYAGNCTSGVLHGPAPGPAPTPSPGALSFDAMFAGAPGAVLQHGAPVAVWGRVAAGAAMPSMLRLLLDGVAAADALVDTASGRWHATLPPQAPAFNRTLTVTVAGASPSASASARVHFGEVVLCSGQSNMGMKVGYGAPHTIPPPGFGANRTSFSADNGTAETAQSGRYTGRIFVRQAPMPANPATEQLGRMKHAEWNDVTPDTLGDFEALCWYAGVSLYEQAGMAAHRVPLGLLTAAVGGSPIEFWIPPSDPDDVNKSPCGVDRPQCDTSGGGNDTQFWREYVLPMLPYTVGALVWDQAERDVKCPASLLRYDCLQRYLVSSWRKAFNSSFAFVGVQLAGYSAALKNGTGTYPDLEVSAEMVYEMRLQQAKGCDGVARCSVVPTYDVSCQAGAGGGCPYGSVHQPHKREIGRRIGLQLYKHIVAPETALVVEGPRATAVTLVGSNGTAHTLAVAFQGGTPPFELRGTRNCTTLPGYCCDGSANGGHTVDFDATHDGRLWANGTNARLSDDKASVHFDVSLPAPPTSVRYTAASIWPQCALYNADGLPAQPFTLPVP